MNLVGQDQRICHVLEFSRNPTRFWGSGARVAACRARTSPLFQRAVEFFGTRAYRTRAKSAEQ